MFAKIFFPIALVLFGAALFNVDRVFFKRNSSFCVRFLYSSLPNRPEWDLPPPSQAEMDQLDAILGQKFHYLAKGCHCYAFASDDGRYVIKFHRFASHMRKFSWLNHPFAYHFNDKRKKIKEHNFARLALNMQSYKNCAESLRGETGLIMLHINRTESLHRNVTLVDKTKAEYQVPLDDVSFILQYKAGLVYPTLDRLMKENKTDEAKEAVASIVSLIADCCQKGFIDEDPMIHKNYGFLGCKAIHIDLGDLIFNEKIRRSENYIPYIKTVTQKLRDRLAKSYPELLTSYEEAISTAEGRTL